ncbi:MAG: hypothetical protein BWY82_01812 [Verrucomicrobia bacterium ADurb.Bin474]|nr:MAG: hypothetical protein BWY82_01812 [Verrucomicrobia bacterium ADurb.Bin474]
MVPSGATFISLIQGMETAFPFLRMYGTKAPSWSLIKLSPNATRIPEASSTMTFGHISLDHD